MRLLLDNTCEAENTWKHKNLILLIGYEIGFVVCVRERVTYYYLYATIVSSYIISQLETSYFSCLRMSSLRKEGTTLHKIFYCGCKIIILPPPPPPFLSPKNFTSWPKKFQKWKIHQIIPCLVVPRISRKTFSQTFGQFTNPDNKKNLQNNSHIWIIKKIFGHSLSKNNYNNKLQLLAKQITKTQ